MFPRDSLGVHWFVLIWFTLAVPQLKARRPGLRVWPLNLLVFLCIPIHSMGDSPLRRKLTQDICLNQISSYRELKCIRQMETKSVWSSKTLLERGDSSPSFTDLGWPWFHLQGRKDVQVGCSLKSSILTLSKISNSIVTCLEKKKEIYKKILNSPVQKKQDLFLFNMENNHEVPPSFNLNNYR